MSSYKNMTLDQNADRYILYYLFDKNAQFSNSYLIQG